MVWLSGLLPYEHAVQAFARIGHRHVPKTNIWRQTQKQGARLKKLVERTQDQVNVTRIILDDERLDHQHPKGISMDGGMVNIREEGWKEFKAGTIFDITTRLAYDEETGEPVERGHAENIGYTAVLGSVESFKPALWALAVAHDVPRAARSSITADAAAWIWNLAPDYFPDSVQIVDWYHAAEHLAKAAHALYPDEGHRAQQWYRRMQKPLFRGEIWQITRCLDEAQLEEQATYFHNHQRRMQYQQFRTEGYPIGSGTVESGIKQYKARLTGAGMRWSRIGAERMFVLRSAVLADNFDELWDAA